MPETEIQFIDLCGSLQADARGFAYFPFQGLAETLPVVDMCTSCHLIAISPGQVRGQHQHPQKTEWLYVFHGQGELFWRTREGQRRQRRLDDHRTLVVISPGIPHALRNAGSDALYLLAWRAALTPGPDEPDTVAAPPW